MCMHRLQRREPVSGQSCKIPVSYTHLDVYKRQSVFWKTVATDRDTCTDPDRCGIELDGSIGSGWRQDGKHRADSPVLADDTVIGTYRTDGEGS